MKKTRLVEATTRLDDSTSSDFLNLHEIIVKARESLSQNDWDFIVGGTESETTLRRNRLALDSIAFRPRILRNVNDVAVTADAFGRKLRLPIVLAPVGGLQAFHPGGAAAVAQAAQEFGVAHMLSSASLPDLEGVAQAAPGALRIYQLYVRGDDAFVDDHVRRAIANDYSAFFLTVDVAAYSRRERDIAKRYKTASRRSSSNTDVGQMYQAALDWRTVQRIKEKFDIPLGIKGVATAEDATIAVEHGVDWIYVSNHGGRQLDHGRGAMDVLPEIVDAVRGRAKIMIDGSFCRGTDVVKAIVAGADLVGIGRMQCYGLAAAGQAGVVRVLELIEDEMLRCLGLLGVTSLGEIDRSYGHAAAPVHLPHVFSAFPLLNIEEYRY